MSSSSFKMVVLGDGAVGKTCMLISFAHNTFPSDYIPTVFDNYNANVIHEVEMITLGLWDTAGQEDYDRLRPLSFPDTDVFLICFSVVDPLSFENVRRKWIPEIRNYFGDLEEKIPPVLLIGTKIDLREEKRRSRRRRDSKDNDNIVSWNEAESLKYDLGIDRYCECSSKTQEGLREVFEDAIEVVFERKKPRYKIVDKKKNRCSIL